MIILPKQAGVALGLLAFSVATLVSIFAGVTFEIAMLRGGIAFLIFVIFGWLIAYIIHEEEKTEPETYRKDTEPEAVKAPEKIVKIPDKTPEAKSDRVEDIEIKDLKPPDDSDF